ncbi:MAG: LacI family DNA-binding transcriptional regulator [Anaerolineales bacterium]|nr:LacI family DNA-binding transcriptional regulator [Anaerolineales bacterium]
MPAHRATSLDVAKLARVSRTTVSFVLNNVEGANISEATRQRVLAAAQKLNYHPNAAGRKLVSGKSNTLGLVLRQSPEQVFADAALLRVMLGIEHAVSLQGYHVLLKPVDPEDSSGYVRLINENHVDGIILSGPRQDDEAIVALHNDGVPIMLIGQLPGNDIPFVDIDTLASAATAVRHLLALGHREIALITNAPLSYTSAQQRCNGYRQALEEAGLPYRETWLREGAYTPASGFAAMADLLKLPQRPSAVFIASDVVAMGAIQALKQAGVRIPEDIAVVGFDDIPLAEYCDPPLTTMHLPAYGLGWAAGERLVRKLLNEDLDQTGVLLKAELVVRRSSTAN